MTHLTHKDIYIKFMIEYDKANVTSSYPSLTEYEVATVLDKAYNALIAQKVTGNNYRRAPFEADVKAISDLQPLVVIEEKNFSENGVKDSHIKNQLNLDIPEDFLYAVGCDLEGTFSHKQWKNTSIQVAQDTATTSTGISYSGYKTQSGEIIPKCFVVNTYGVDRSGSYFTVENCRDSSLYQWFVGTVEGSSTVVKNVLQFGNIEAVGNYISSGIDLTYVIWANLFNADKWVLHWHTYEAYQSGNPYDGHAVRTAPCQLVDFLTAQRFFCSSYNIPWIKNPVYYIHEGGLFIVYDTTSKYVPYKYVFKYIKKPNTFVKDLPIAPIDEDLSFFDGEYGRLEFELNDTMAEELITLAITYALENVESPRLNSKLNMRGLEA